MEYENIEVDISHLSKDGLLNLIEYMNDNDITFNQAISRILISSLIESCSYHPNKVKCERCGKLFYGDILSYCSKCKEDPNMLHFITDEMHDIMDEALPLWMITSIEKEHMFLEI